MFLRAQGPGACGSECRTVAKACQDLIDSIDVLELGEKVWSNPPADQLAKSLCREMSDVCVQPDPPIPKVCGVGGGPCPNGQHRCRSCKQAGMSGRLVQLE